MWYKGKRTGWGTIWDWSYSCVGHSGTPVLKYIYWPCWAGQQPETFPSGNITQIGTSSSCSMVTWKQEATSGCRGISHLCIWGTTDLKFSLHLRILPVASHIFLLFWDLRYFLHSDPLCLGRRGGTSDARIRYFSPRSCVEAIKPCLTFLQVGPWLIFLQANSCFMFYKVCSSLNPLKLNI